MNPRVVPAASRHRSRGHVQIGSERPRWHSSVLRNAVLVSANNKWQVRTGKAIHVVLLLCGVLRRVQDVMMRARWTLQGVMRARWTHWTSSVALHNRSRSAWTTVAALQIECDRPELT